MPSIHPQLPQPPPGCAPGLGKDEPKTDGTQSFPKSCRLLKRWEFERVYNQGKKLVQRNVIVYSLATQNQEKKAGIAAGKTVGTAVIRNRIRRRIREVLRRSLNLWLPGYQVVVVARAHAKDLDYWQLKKTIEGLLIRSGVMEKES